MKKVILLVLVLVGLFTLSGCKYESDMDVVKNLVQQQIFEQKEEKYFIFFYLDGCTGCEETKPSVMNYYNLVKNDDSKRKIYGVNLSNPKNNPMYVKNPLDVGQGTDGAFYVNGVTNWEDLNIGSTPSLISIYIKDGVKTAKYVAQGKDAIITALEEQLR